MGNAYQFLSFFGIVMTTMFLLQVSKEEKLLLSIFAIMAIYLFGVMDGLTIGLETLF